MRANFLTPLLLPLCAGAIFAAPAHAIESGSVGAYRYDARYRLADANDPRPYAREIAVAARSAAIDPELIHAVVAVESGYRPAAVSNKGAVGLMQVLPETARSYGVNDPRDVAGNLQAGARYLGALINRFDQRLDLALAAYNAGEGAVRQHGNAIPPYPETQQYVPAVLQKYRASNLRTTTRPAASAPRPVPARTYLTGTRIDARLLQQYR